ncbi:MAG: transglutaminase family protein [Bryobacter sp.]|nr:transglutaminase family protein [Bryobacter sp. CoA8 C33]
MGGVVDTQSAGTNRPAGFAAFRPRKLVAGGSLPRWAFTCYWRADGMLLWRHAQWIANPETGYGNEQARAFAEALARGLAIGPEFVIAAFEDPLEYVHKERQLPVNLEPGGNRLQDPEERERLRRLFERRLDETSGFVLPLAKIAGKDGAIWQSERWMPRSRHLYLIPGDSPVRFRLPLKSSPHAPAGTQQQIFTLGPMPPRGALPEPVQREMGGLWRQPLQRRQAVQERSLNARQDKAVRTA